MKGAIDPEEFGEFSHATYKSKIDGRDDETKERVDQLVDMFKSSKFRNKDKLIVDLEAM